jgi:putative oxidoreductase
VQIRQPEGLARLGIQLYRPQLSAILLRRVQAPHELPDPRAVEIRDMAKVEQELLASLSVQIEKQIMDRLALNERESSSHVNHGDIAELARAGTEYQGLLLRDWETAILSHAGRNSETQPGGQGRRAAMIFPQLVRFSDVALLLLRLMIGVVFLSSGSNHLKDPTLRAKSIGMSKGFTIFLGAAEVAGSLGVIFGVLSQLAALGLIVLMLGAIQRKIVVWHTGFWGKDGNGWHYDLMLVVMNLVVATTGGGRLVLWR